MKHSSQHPVHMGFGGGRPLVEVLDTFAFGLQDIQQLLSGTVEAADEAHDTCEGCPGPPKVIAAHVTHDACAPRSYL
eukprot:4822256-Amphidinium_carterae.1